MRGAVVKEWSEARLTWQDTRSVPPWAIICATSSLNCCTCQGQRNHHCNNSWSAGGGTGSTHTCQQLLPNCFHGLCIPQSAQVSEAVDVEYALIKRRTFATQSALVQNVQSVLSTKYSWSESSSWMLLGIIMSECLSAISLACLFFGRLRQQEAAHKHLLIHKIQQALES